MTTKDKKTQPKGETEELSLEELLKQNLSEDPSVEFEIAWEQVEPVYKKVIGRTAKQVKQKGFRPGKVPAHLAEEIIDQNYLIQTVLRELAPPAYAEAVKEKKLTSVSEPELMVKKADKNEAWLLVAFLPQKPEIKLPDYKKILTESKAKAVKKLEAEQKQAKEEFENKQKTEAEKSEFKGLTPEQIKAQATDLALVELLKAVKPKVSQILTKRTAQKEFEKLTEQLQQYQVSLDDYLKNTGMTMEVISQQLMLNAMQNLQMEFMLDALLEAETITVNEVELKEKIAELLPDVKTEEDKQKQLSEPSVKQYVELIAKRKKLADWLLDL